MSLFTPTPDLVAVLSQLDLNTEIPQALYQAVAEVFAFVYRMDRRMGGAIPPLTMCRAGGQGNGTPPDADAA